MSLMDTILWFFVSHPTCVESLDKYIRGAFNKFPDFFCMGTFIDSTHMKL